MRHAHELLADEATLHSEHLNTPISALPVSIRQSPLLSRALRMLRRELRRAGIRLRPNFYLSDEYGCVEGTANIGIPFWDADESLRRLIRDVRGSWNTFDDVMEYLRHETGHAFCYSYKLYQTREFRRLFRVEGHFFRSYPEDNRYRRTCNPWSRDYVNPSGDHYAQKHPDEDFSETFAVWIDPHSRWRVAHARKPGALRKLEYVDRIVGRFGGADPIVRNDPKALHLPLDEMKETVGEFFRTSGRQFRRQARAFFDHDLAEIFTPRARVRRGVIAAGDFLDTEGPMVEERIVYWTGEKRSIVHALLRKIGDRARALDLVVPRAEKAQALVELSAYLTTLMMNYAYRSRFNVDD